MTATLITKFLLSSRRLLYRKVFLRISSWKAIDGSVLLRLFVIRRSRLITRHRCGICLSDMRSRQKVYPNVYVFLWPLIGTRPPPILRACIQGSRRNDGVEISKPLFTTRCSTSTRLLKMSKPGIPTLTFLDSSKWLLCAAFSLAFASLTPAFVSTSPATILRCRPSNTLT